MTSHYFYTIPSTWICFRSENFFVTCSWFFLGMVREKRGGRGGQGEGAWSVKYKCTLFCCSQRTKSCCICFEVKFEIHQTSLQKWELLSLLTTHAQSCGVLTFSRTTALATHIPYNTCGSMHTSPHYVLRYITNLGCCNLHILLSAATFF